MGRLVSVCTLMLNKTRSVIPEGTVDLITERLCRATLYEGKFTGALFKDWAMKGQAINTFLSRV